MGSYMAVCTRRNSVPFTPCTVVEIALDTLMGNSRSTKHFLEKGQTVLLVITLFPDLAQNSSVEKTTITVITTLLACAFASDYNL